jgi:hypothetical protein
MIFYSLFHPDQKWRKILHCNHFLIHLEKKKKKKAPSLAGLASLHKFKTTLNASAFTTDPLNPIALTNINKKTWVLINVKQFTSFTVHEGAMPITGLSASPNEKPKTHLGDIYVRPQWHIWSPIWP